MTEAEELRRVLWAHHGHSGLYGGYGEMRCSLRGESVDFKRDPVEKLEAHVMKPDVRRVPMEVENLGTVWVEVPEG